MSSFLIEELWSQSTVLIFTCVVITVFQYLDSKNFYFPFFDWVFEDRISDRMGSCHNSQKRQAPTPQAPIRNRQTRKVANAKIRNRDTNLTYIMIGLPIMWRLRTFAFATFLVWRLRIGARSVGACGFWLYPMHSN